MSQQGSGSTLSRLGYTVASVILTGGVAFLALRAGRPPEPLSRSTTASSFSAERAMDHVVALARKPRPVGSAAHAEAADYVFDQLTALGLETEFQQETFVGAGAGGKLAVRVRNVLARWPGSGGAGTLLLMAHYDSQPQTFGAGDDAAGVATLLETLRALRLEGPLANEIVVAVTDGEELGLVGAEAFVQLHPWFEGVDRTLNFEARGQRGATLMFETASGGLQGARDLAHHAPWPVASSMSYEVYRRMPNDTDFSVIRRADGHGLNFAFIGGLSAYHSHLDTAARLDRSTLQHMGSNALAMTRYYGGAELDLPAKAEGVYFNPWGLRPLWVFSAATAQGVALAALALALAVTFFMRSRRDLALKRLILGWGLVLVGVGAAMALTWAAWGLLGRSGPTPYNIPYAEGLASLGLVMVAFSGWIFCLNLWRGGPWELLASLGLLWGGLGVASALLMPGASHLFVGPALFGALGLAVAYRTENPWWVVVIGLLPSVLLWAPALQLSYLALTVRAAVILSLASLLAITLATPVVAWLGGRLRQRGATLLLALGLGFLGWATHGATPSVDQPLVDSLFVLYDRESGEATWHSLDAQVDDWTSRALGLEPSYRPLPKALDRRQREVLSNPASLPSPATTLTVVRERDERPAGGRSVAIRFNSSGAANLRLWIYAEVALAAVSIDGHPGELDENGELRLSLHGDAPDGFLLEIEMGDRWPLQIEVVEVSYGLPLEAGERPASLIPRPGWWTDTTMVKTGFTL